MNTILTFTEFQKRAKECVGMQLEYGILPFTQPVRGIIASITPWVRLGKIPACAIYLEGSNVAFYVPYHAEIVSDPSVPMYVQGEFHRVRFKILLPQPELSFSFAA